MKSWSVKKLTLVALLLAMALGLSIAESFIPFGVPGAKLGLANLVILIALYSFGLPVAFFLDLGRVLLASICTGTFLGVGFFMSLSGAMVSLLVMWGSIRLLKKLTPVGVSLLGAYAHALAQIFVGVIYFGSWAVFYYFPVMAALGLLTGILNGVLTELVRNNRFLQRQIDSVKR